MRRATLRLQLHAGFDFDAAAHIVPLLARIGVSHVYTSPVLQAARGSAHGYDVVDPTRVNDELGGEHARARFSDALRAHGIGWLLDIVPNHMEISDPRNMWWWDVLENGPSSPYASFFDIDWSPPEPKLKDVVLMPILGDHRGRVLERREIRLERHAGFFVVRYYDHTLPLAPRTLNTVVRMAAGAGGLDDDERDLLGFLADAHVELLAPPGTDPLRMRRRHRDKRVLRRLLARTLDDAPRLAAAVDDALGRLNDDPDALDLLLERQSYRLAWWRTSERELDYRRFFDVNHLVAMRMDDPAVFAETHALVLAWAEAGVIDGVRVDHVDGLADPAGYLARLRARLPSSWILVEKILSPDEALRSSWHADGTTGYDFLDLLDAVFTDPRGERTLRELFARFTGETRSFEDVAHDKKLFVLSDVLASDAKRVTALVSNLCAQDRMMRDTTRHELHEAVCALAASFPVYRSYVVDACAPEDRAVIEQALATARARHPNVDPELFAWLGRLVKNEVPGLDEPAARDARVRFQQLCAPVMAKGVEDTAFYCWHVLDSACEVGADPARMTASVEELHRENARAHEHRPHRLLTTSTHDTKRSEDVRARIAVLSELAPEWTSLVDRLALVGGKHRGPLVDRAAELSFFQTLVGTWPIDVERVVRFMEKAAREAKVHTSWVRPNEEYERQLRDYVRAMMADADVEAALSPFLAVVVPAARLASTAKTLVKMTSPGVPDIYQGCDLWDESLVDPDNRRPVDWELRARLLDELDRLEGDPASLMARLDDGLPKLHVIRTACRLRARRPALFDAGAEGRYAAIHASGPNARCCVAFARGRSGEVVVAVPRFTARFALAAFEDTVLALPAGRWHSLLDGAVVDAGAAGVSLAELWRRFPAALLEGPAHGVATSGAPPPRPTSGGRETSGGAR